MITILLKADHLPNPEAEQKLVAALTQLLKDSGCIPTVSSPDDGLIYIKTALEQKELVPPAPVAPPEEVVAVDSPTDIPSLPAPVVSPLIPMEAFIVNLTSKVACQLDETIEDSILFVEDLTIDGDAVKFKLGNLNFKTHLTDSALQSVVSLDGLQLSTNIKLVEAKGKKASTLVLGSRVSKRLKEIEDQKNDTVSSK